MKRIFKLLLCTAVLSFVASCNDESEDVPSTNPEEVITSGSYLYTLNSGSYGYNNASLSCYNIDSKDVATDIFPSVNGQSLGDTAQDIIVFGEQMFITVYGSSIIFVTDLKGEIITTITNSTYNYPRYLASDDESVYVSYYDGAVAKIDPVSYSLTTSAITTYGNPEELDVVNGLIYVAVSDYGYGNEESVVAVFDAESLEFVENIAVVLNPTILDVDSKGNIYVISMGNYGYADPAIYATLQKIEAETYTVSTLSISNEEDALPAAIAVGKDDVLYVVEGVSNASTYWTMIGDVYTYDDASGDVVQFITDGTSVPTIYSISTDKESGEVYVGSSDYYNTGDVYLFNADGTLNTTIAVGTNPMKSVKVQIAEEE